MTVIAILARNCAKGEDECGGQLVSGVVMAPLLRSSKNGRYDIVFEALAAKA